MKVHIEVMTPEGAIVAARVAAAVAAAMNGEGTVTSSTTTRTRRTAAQIAADKAAEGDANKPAPAADAQVNTAADGKPDAVAEYLKITGGDTTSSVQPDTAKPSNPQPDTAAGTVVDPLEAMLAAAAAAPATPPPTKTRDEMIAAVVALMGVKGVPWAREHIITKYSATKFADMADEKVLKIYTENCV